MLSFFYCFLQMGYLPIIKKMIDRSSLLGCCFRSAAARWSTPFSESRSVSPLLIYGFLDTNMVGFCILHSHRPHTRNSVLEAGGGVGAGEAAKGVEDAQVSLLALTAVFDTRNLDQRSYALHPKSVRLICTLGIAILHRANTNIFELYAWWPCISPHKHRQSAIAKG